MSISIQHNIPLKALNTFGIQSLAREFVELHSVEEFIDLTRMYPLTKKKHVILGGGSNVLLPDVYEGLAIHNAIKGFGILEEAEDHLLLKAGGGELWHDLVLKTLELNVGGLENLSLIPGTVGAAPMQNIGAYGVELKDSFESLEAISIKTGELRTFSKANCQFGYRTSVFKQELKSQYFIASVTFRLSKHPQLHTAYGAIEGWLNEHGVSQPTIHDVSRAVIAIRRSKLPNPAILGNAGSFFKNPIIAKVQFEALQAQYPEMPHYPDPSAGQVKIPAAWLLEQCGWKGYRNESCGVHDQQALVLVNHGGATAKDLLQLASDIERSVKEKFGIVLGKEVNLVE